MLAAGCAEAEPWFRLSYGQTGSYSGPEVCFWETCNILSGERAATARLIFNCDFQQPAALRLNGGR